MLAVAGDTTTVVEGGGGGSGLVPREVAEQPAAKSTARMPPNCSNLRIFQVAHRELLKAEYSLEDGKSRGYWTEGQYLGDVREMRRSGTSISE